MLSCTARHGLQWIWQRMTIKWTRFAASMPAARRISQRYVRSWTARWSTFPPTTYLTDRVLSPGIRTARTYQPLNVYGQTKLEGELAVSETLDKYFIVRIAWVFGINGKNFIKTMLNVGKTHDTLKVVSDQVGTPTYTYDLARLLVDMIETDKYGYYHVTNEGGYISWYDFTKEIFRQAVELGHTEYSEDRLTVLPVTTAEYGLSKAKRPFNSRLDKSKLVKNGFTPLPTWQDALRRYLKEIGM